MKSHTIKMTGFVLWFNLALYAAVIHTCGENWHCSRTETGNFNEDYLFMGNNLTFSGEVEDLYFLGKDLTFSGKAKLGLFSLCDDLSFSGSAGNGIMAGAMDVTIGGTVTGTSFFGCGSFSLSESGTISGPLFIGCSYLTIDGVVNGDLFAGAQKIYINNVVNGNVKAYAGRLILGEKGKINGNLTYTSQSRLTSGDSSKVSGTVTYKDIRDHGMAGWSKAGKTVKAAAGWITLSIFISYVVVGILLLFIPVFRKLDDEQSERAFLHTLLWGLIPILIYPALVILCFVLVVTIPLALVLLAAIVPSFFFANIIGTTLLGKYIAMKFNWNIDKRHYQFLIGAVAGGILSLVPFLNFLAFILICALGWGVFAGFLFDRDVSGDRGDNVNQ